MADTRSPFGQVWGEARGHGSGFVASIRSLRGLKQLQAAGAKEEADVQMHLVQRPVRPGALASPRC